MIDEKKPYRAWNMIFNKLDMKSDAETGYLDISVFDNNSHEALNNGVVSIYEVTLTGMYGESGEGKLFTMHTTDIYGKVPLIGIPATDHSYYDDNPPEYPSTQYLMTITVPGYYNAYVFNLQFQIYPQITTVYRIYMHQIDSGLPRFEVIITPSRDEIHNPNI